MGVSYVTVVLLHTSSRDIRIYYINSLLQIFTPLG